MDSYDAQVAESIKSLFELTSRIDERVKTLSDNALRQDDKLEQIANSQQKLLERVVALESKNGEATKKAVEEVKKLTDDLERRTRGMEIQMKAVEIISKGNTNKWDRIADVVWKFVIIIAASFLIWKLGMGG